MKPPTSTVFYCPLCDEPIGMPMTFRPRPALPGVAAWTLTADRQPIVDHIATHTPGPDDGGEPLPVRSAAA